MPIGLPQTPGLQVILRLAQDLASKMKSPLVRPEHCLLAILQRGAGMAHQIFGEFKIAPSSVARSLVESMREAGGSGAEPAPGECPGDDLLESANRIAAELGCPWVSTEHLLLAMMKEEGTVASKVLYGAGFDYEKARSTALALYGDRFPDACELQRLLKEQGVDWNDPSTLSQSCECNPWKPLTD